MTPEERREKATIEIERLIQKMTRALEEIEPVYADARASLVRIEGMREDVLASVRELHRSW